MVSMWPFTSTQTAPKEEAWDPTPSPSQDFAPYVSVQQAIAESPNASIQTDTPVGLTGLPNERLGMHPILRAPAVMLTSFGCGFILGSTHGSTKGANRYRAENAHRLPTTQTGWFLYQKSKNYHAMFGGVKEGTKLGSTCMGWASLFMITEEMVDLSRTRLLARRGDDVATGQRDAGSTIIAAMSVAGIYSWKRGLDHFATVHIARIALKYSIMYGLAQDVAATVRGSPPGYIAWLRKTFWTTDAATFG
jgi:hypothetical protein